MRAELRSPLVLLGADGLAPGDYAVTVVWPNYEINGGEEIQTGDKLKGRYGSIERPAAKVTIQPGKNELPTLDLKRR